MEGGGEQAQGRTRLHPQDPGPPGLRAPAAETRPELGRPNHRQTPRTEQNIPSSSNSLFPFSWLESKGERSVSCTPTHAAGLVGHGAWGRTWGLF